MKGRILTTAILLLTVPPILTVRAGNRVKPGNHSAQAGAEAAVEESRKVYGEWRIHVRPDKGSDYNRLIEEKGRPLFREADGRMVERSDRKPVRTRDHLGNGPASCSGSISKSATARAAVSFFERLL